MGTPKRLIINESGLYSLIIKSRKPEAKAFKKWITSEVLASIRKTGDYQLPVEKEDMGRYIAKKYLNPFTHQPHMTVN